MIAERERRIHTRIGRLRLDRCDYIDGTFCDEPAVCIVETIKEENRTVDRRPACAVHAESMAYYPAACGLRGVTHYLERAGQ